VKGAINAVNGPVVMLRTLTDTGTQGVRWTLPSLLWEPVRLAGGLWRVGPGAYDHLTAAGPVWVGGVGGGLRVYSVLSGEPEVFAMAEEAEPYADSPPNVTTNYYTNLGAWTSLAATLETQALGADMADVFDLNTTGAVDLYTGEVTEFREAQLVAVFASNPDANNQVMPVKAYQDPATKQVWLLPTGTAIPVEYSVPLFHQTQDDTIFLNN
jgi:hypothetical protein